MKPSSEHPYADIELVRRSLNQLTDHGSQHCLDCQKHRQDGMDALDRLERGMRLERHLIEALEHIAAVPEWWQGKVAREALAHVRV